MSHKTFLRLCAFLCMLILTTQWRSKRLSYSTLRDRARHFSNQCDICKVAKWFTKTSQTINKTSEMYAHMHARTLHALSLCCVLTLTFFVVVNNQRNQHISCQGECSVQLCYQCVPFINENALYTSVPCNFLLLMCAIYQWSALYTG